jgi:hypothetical protein
LLSTIVVLICVIGVEPIKAIPIAKRADEEAAMRPVISNSHVAVQDGRPPPIPEEIPIGYAGKLVQNQ